MQFRPQQLRQPRPHPGSIPAIFVLHLCLNMRFEEEQGWEAECWAGQPLSVAVSQDSLASPSSRGMEQGWGRARQKH